MTTMFKNHEAIQSLRGNYGDAGFTILKAPVQYTERGGYLTSFEGKDVGGRRLSHAWYMKANKMCEQNYLNLFNPNWKSFTWSDVWNQ